MNSTFHKDVVAWTAPHVFRALKEVIKKTRLCKKNAVFMCVHYGPMLYNFQDVQAKKLRGENL